MFVKNRNDRKILHLSWIYGVYFRFTLAEIERNRYLDRIVVSLPSAEVIREIHHSLRSYLARRIPDAVSIG
ncbi:MAG: hypothetical protein M0Z41_06155 [Peptococcaceae bacterium]|jgi:hypothetical protein|nr:hypothetical protein [Peptococcaceae bacterium]